jgi:hypothetical protein
MQLQFSGLFLEVARHAMSNKRLQASFKPTEVGSHKVEILHNAEHIKGSPFTVEVGVLHVTPTGNGIFGNF